MPSTTKWGIPYPNSTPDAPHGPNNMRDLALGVENNALPILGLRTDLAGISASGAGSGRTFFATDSGEYFVSNGTAWKSVWMAAASDLLTWRDLDHAGMGQAIFLTGSGTQGVAGTLYILERLVSNNNLQSGIANGANYANPHAVLHLDPTEYAISGRTTQMRLVTYTNTTGTAGGSTITYGLHQATSIANNYHPSMVVNDTAATGSTVAVSPTGAGIVRTVGSPFTMPSAGHYKPMFRVSAPLPLSTRFGLVCQLQYRWI